MDAPNLRSRSMLGLKCCEWSVLRPRMLWLGVWSSFSMSTCSDPLHQRCHEPCRHSCCHRHNSTSCSIGGLAIYHLAWRRLISRLWHNMRWPTMWHSVWSPFSVSTTSHDPLHSQLQHKNMAHSVAQPCKLPYQTSCWSLIDRETLDIVGSDYGTMADRVAGIV